MYSNKENVNILTALLVKHGVKHAVLCPGSRNAPIVHNLNECPDITCYSVSDERSAGFYAFGMCQATGSPVVVCVTSGTALLNLAPSVAEAYYLHQSLIVVSADRPVQWIDQLDGQTLPQTDALGRFVRKAVSLPEPRDDEERWYCNRLVNEAMLDSRRISCAPVHINVPISEPLFEFNVEALPDERKIERYRPTAYPYYVEQFVERFLNARKPMIVVGQMASQILVEEDLRRVADDVVVLTERLCPAILPLCHFDEVLHHVGMDENYMSDMVLYIGDSVVSKRLKKFLRAAKDAEVWTVQPDGAVQDTFQHLAGVIEGEPDEVLCVIAEQLNEMERRDDLSAFDLLAHTPLAFRSLWQKALDSASKHAADFVPAFSQMSAVRFLEQRLSQCDDDSYRVHYANSTSVRLANIYSPHFVFCNRGVNGIEGSLSTAAGFSVVTSRTVFCVIGDLSFFYDQNALWNQNLRGNFRIVLLNNGSGGIFRQLSGLQESPYRDHFVAASHATTAEGICRQNHVAYLSAHNQEKLEQGMETLVSREADLPMLLEVFTDAETDAKVYQEYYKTFKI